MLTITQKLFNCLVKWLNKCIFCRIAVKRKEKQLFRGRRKQGPDGFNKLVRSEDIPDAFDLPPVFGVMDLPAGNPELIRPFTEQVFRDTFQIVNYLTILWMDSKRGDEDDSRKGSLKIGQGFQRDTLAEINGPAPMKHQFILSI